MSVSKQEGAALQLLGLAKRAGAVIVGVPLICESLQKGRIPALILLAADAAENSKKRMRDRAAFYRAELTELESGCEQLAHCVGKRDGVVAAIAVTDAGLALAIKSRLKAEKSPNG